jgi:hypothetical protein
MNRILGNIVIVLSASIVAGCLMTDSDDTSFKQDMISTVIVGSAESPDPILERVMELEEDGILENVIVMESFPVQIRLTGPRYII